MASFVSGLERLDAAAVVVPFSDDATAFFPDSANQPSRVEGKPAIEAVFRRFFEELRRNGTTSMTLRPMDMRIDLAGDAAVVTFHLRGGNMISRRTFVLRRRGGVWRIIHLHASSVQLVS
jgi:ketosteroid isomerase-like protein